MTQPAVAAYEAGRRHPTGYADVILNGMIVVFDGAVVEDVDERGRPVELPEGRWTPVVPRDAVVRLPTRLDWSPRRNPIRDLSDPARRAATYAQVLDEGAAADVRFWIDPDALVQMWPDVPVARRIRPHVEAMVERLRNDPSCAA